MGAWGPGIFSDDLACDLRDEFRELVAEGHSPRQATERLRSDYVDVEDLPDQHSVFCLALAATQWKLGRLLDDVRDEALRLIDSGEALELWKSSLIDEEDVRSVRRRQTALEKLREQLLKPQPGPKQIRLPFASRTEWEIGYAVAYRLGSGRHIVFRVIGMDKGRRHRHAIVDIADWIGDEPPVRKEIEGLSRLPSVLFAVTPRTPGKQPPALTHALKSTPENKRLAVIENFRENPWIFAGGRSGPPESDGVFELFEDRPNEMPTDRTRVIATDLPVSQAEWEGAGVFGGWSLLDEFLEISFELR